MIFALAFVLAAAVMTLVLRMRHVEPGFESGQKVVVRIPAPAAGPQPAPTVAAPNAALASEPSASVASPSQGGVVKGEVAERTQPDISQGARDTIRGQVSVTVRVAVDAGGNVSNATLDSPGPSRYFARQALEAAQHWKFKPAQAGGQAVASAWTLQFRFTQDGTDITPVEVSP
jgi:TonB family protein